MQVREDRWDKLRRNFRSVRIAECTTTPGLAGIHKVERCPRRGVTAAHRSTPPGDRAEALRSFPSSRRKCGELGTRKGAGRRRTQQTFPFPSAH
jgi:hypothetical protein